MAQRQPRTHKSNNQPDDVFVEKVLHLGKWAEAHQQLLTVLGVVAAVAVLGLVYYNNYRSNLNLQAAGELEQIYQSVSLQDVEGARGQLATFLERYAGAAQEAEARLLLGELYLEDGSPQQAQAVLRPLGESPRRPLEFQAAALLAAALEEDRQWSAAQDIYLRIADRSDLDFQVHNALAAAARIRQDQGDLRGAVALYQRLVGEFEDGDPRRGVFEMRIQEIESATSA
jgi:predicted negative regulator of RcsB-dependent stress response